MTPLTGPDRAIHNIKVVIEMAELQCLEVEHLMADPDANQHHLAHAGSMFLDMAQIALSFGMDGTVARKMEDMSVVVTNIQSSDDMWRDYRVAREQLAYVLAPYKPQP